MRTPIQRAREPLDGEIWQITDIIEASWETDEHRAIEASKDARYKGCYNLWALNDDRSINRRRAANRLPKDLYDFYSPLLTKEESTILDSKKKLCYLINSEGLKIVQELLVDLNI